MSSGRSQVKVKAKGKGQQASSSQPAHSLVLGANVGMILQPSCKMFNHFLRGLCSGKWDVVIAELGPGIEPFRLSPFWLPEVWHDRRGQDNASRFAAIAAYGSEPAEHVEEEDLPQQAADIPEGAAGGEVDAEDDDVDEKKQQGLKEKTLEHD